MKRDIITTNDGSTTFHLPEWDEQYHSRHGAIQESKHVFVNQGLHQFKNRHLNLLEMGFGTGLNCLLTVMALEDLDLNVQYVGVEAYPLNIEEVLGMNYLNALRAPEYEAVYNRMHEVEWDRPIQLTKRMMLTKREQRFETVNDEECFDLVYYDAFGARVQPELWTMERFDYMYKAMKMNGVLVTYSAKGSVRRAMQEVGFTVERLEGPPGKREMLRATKK
jgi:tRNA U34 5-methylaminomethyl-2-thiouridine-forming methyltransferase MnmC